MKNIWNILQTFINIFHISQLGYYNSPTLKKRNVLVATQRHVSRHLSGQNRDG